MKRLLITAAAISTLSLAACGGGDDAATPEAPQAPSTPTTTSEAPAAPPTPEPAPEPEEEAVDERAATILAALGEPYISADLRNGQRRFRLCQSCHTLPEDGRHMVGPNLYGLFSRNVGDAEDFRYSNALQEADFAWTPAELEQWLANPRGYLPGNRMSFAGVRNEDDRHDLIAYLAVETHSE
ncbi:MAG: cytochrome c family protein [Pseudomonadota bacterium]